MDKKRISFIAGTGKRRLLAGVVSVSLLATASTSLAFADTDLKGRIMAWADKQTAVAVDELESAIGSEREIQKLRLQEQLQAGLARQTAEFENFTAEKKAHYIEQLRLHADGLIQRQSGEDALSEERARVNAALELILGQATDAMNRLDALYLPPVIDNPVRTAPEKAAPVENDPAVAAPPVEPPSVTDNVYQAVYSPTAIQ